MILKDNLVRKAQYWKPEDLSSNSDSSTSQLFTHQQVTSSALTSGAQMIKCGQ